MKHLWDQLFLSIMPSTVYQDAAVKFSQMNVLQSVNGEIVGNERVIEGSFKYMHQDIVCKIILSQQLELLSFQCTEPKSQYLYLGAMLLFLKEIGIDSFPFYENSPAFLAHQKKIADVSVQVENNRMMKMTSKSRSLIVQAKKHYLMDLEELLVGDALELKPTLVWNKDDSYPSVSYQIGKERFYIIKNITEFMERIEKREEYAYGKKLKFIHTPSAFSESAKDQIRFIQYVISENTKEIDPYFSYSSYVPTRFLELDSLSMDAFFDTYQTMDTDGFLCVDAEDKIPVQVKEDRLTYTFSCSPLISFYSGKTHYYQIQEKDRIIVIYRYKLDENGKAIAFLNMLYQEPLIVMKSEYSDFYKYYLSDIEKYLEIDSEAERIEIDDFSYLQLYADIDDQDRGVIRIKCFNNDNEVRWGFNHDYTSSYQQDLIEEVIRRYAYEIDYANHCAYIRTDQEQFFDFFQIALPKLSEYCEIYVSDAIKRIGKNQHYAISVGVRLNNGLLEIDVNSPDIPKEELGQVLNAYRRKKKFFRLKNGKILTLDSQDLKELDQFAEDYQISPTQFSSTTTIPAYRMMDLENKEEELKNITLQRDQMLENAMQAWHQDSIENNPLLPKYDHLLRNYQKSGVQWMSKLSLYRFGGILADDMGLGKTLQVIALLEGLEEKGQTLVICPASLVYNWEEEVRKFSSSLKTICITGNADQRKLRISQYQDYDLLITSYDYLKRDIDLYDAIVFNYVILDEAQYIKNHKTKNATSVKQLHAKNRLALTGTPIENSLAELWSIFDFLMPGYLYNYHYFQTNYESDIVKYKNMEKQAKLKQLVSPFILRRNKTEVLTELPEKIETNYLIDFNEEEKKIYYANLAQANTELAAMKNVEAVDKIVILKILLKLRQICCEPRLVYENIETLSSKLQACMELIENLKENNKKALLFSSFTSMLELIAVELNKRGISYLMLTGSTNKEERRRMVEQFQKDDTTVFLISLKAGGTGLNLTAAEAVIHYDPWWNISAQNQATDRAYRIGQNKKVQVFKLIIKNSIEEKIQELQNAKKDLADTFVEGNTGSIGQMSKDEIMSLFKMD